MKIFLDMVGCRLNQSEIEAYAHKFRSAGHELVAEPGHADLAVINTCAVTTQAASDSRQKIRQAGRAGANQITVTGCWSTLQPEAASGLPGVTGVVPNLVKDNLVELIIGKNLENFELEPLIRQPVPGARLRTRAFIKVQDGCDNRCTFCVTTLARGESRSRSPAEVLADVQAASRGGAQEIVLTGVHLGSWGQDFAQPKHLRELVELILIESDVPRVRLSSLEPWDLDGNFFKLWEDPRICRHLHLPLQSGCPATLRRMARKTTPAAFASLVAAARQAVPNIAITTDVITGFPGETEEEFTESLAFIEEMDFAGGHTFTYSARPGTAAAHMPGQVPPAIRKERNARLRAVFSEATLAYQRRFLNHVLPVLWESAIGLGPEGWHLSGLTDNYLRVHASAPQSPGYNPWNQITPVRLISPTGEGLEGLITAEMCAQ